MARTKFKTKKMTTSYWKGLSEGSKRRALTYVFPIHPVIVDMLLDEKPNLREFWWQRVWDEVRIPEDPSHYKTVIRNSTYIC